MACQEKKKKKTHVSFVNLLERDRERERKPNMKETAWKKTKPKEQKKTSQIVLC